MSSQITCVCVRERQNIEKVASAACSSLRTEELLMIYSIISKPEKLVN